jgi:hypothetical protein
MLMLPYQFGRFVEGRAVDPFVIVVLLLALLALLVLVG